MTTSAEASETDYPVHVEIPRPRRTSRLLVLLRTVLLLPHYFYATAVLLVALVLLLLNYVIVLITARPAFFGFLAGTLRYLTRFSAYLYFLTDKYPPFSLGDDPDYPVRVIVQRPGKIHRWRVFSYVLALPHVLVLYVLLILSALATVVAFFIILVVGRYPAGLFNISAAAMRYQTRVNAYLYLIVDRYPPFSLG